MEVSPYLNFDGRCAEAFRFYEERLGGRLEFLQTHGDSPMREHVPPAWHDKVMHARLVLGGQALMGCDAPPDHYATPQGLTVSITADTTVEAERIFTALAEGGRTTMPFAQTFWSAGFGMAVDRFGIPWMVNSAEQA